MGDGREVPGDESRWRMDKNGAASAVISHLQPRSAAHFRLIVCLRLGSSGSGTNWFDCGGCGTWVFVYIAVHRQAELETIQPD